MPFIGWIQPASSCEQMADSLKHRLVFALLLPGPSFSQTISSQHPEEFHGTVARQVEMKYLLFIPEGYNTDRKWPLIMYLHGGSRRGNDIEKLREPGYGLPAIVEKNAI